MNEYDTVHCIIEIVDTYIHGIEIFCDNNDVLQLHDRDSMITTCNIRMRVDMYTYVYG